MVTPPSLPHGREREYVSYEGNYARTEMASLKRKRDTFLGHVLHTKDQRADADEAVRRLQEAIGDILEADDEFQISGQSESQASQMLTTVTVGESTITTLTSTPLATLDASLQKVITLRRLDDVSTDHLHRIQDLCTGLVAFAAELDWKVEDLENSTSQLDELDLSLRSARSILRIMSSARDDKRLFPEELLLTIVRALAKSIDHIKVIAEARSSDQEAGIFETALTCRKPLVQLLNNAHKVINLLIRVVISQEMAESVLSPLEFSAIDVLFIDNASNEKDSVLGIQKFENFRRSAVDLVSGIYSRCRSQREGIFRQVLTSLSSLPSGRQARRHMKLRDGKAIQMITVLFMELVQAVGTSNSPSKNSKKIASNHLGDEGINGGGEGALVEDQDQDMATSDQENGSEDSEESSEEENIRQSSSVRRLNKVTSPVCNLAAQTAHRAAQYIVNRAQTSTKSGDSPFRQILDVFVEDLLEVLGMPEWPGAEILLRAFFKSFHDIIEDSKSLTPAKNMSLELLGNMGSAISELVSKTQRAAKNLDSQESHLAASLIQLMGDYAEGSLDPGELILWNGPYHAVVDHLTPHGPEDLHNMTAQGYYLAQWAKALSSVNLKDNIIATRLRVMLQKVDYFPFETQESVSDTQAQVAYSLTILNMDFCRQFDYILRVLLRSINTEQTTVRSRALKSVTQMLETDPTLLDRSRDIRLSIGQCISDASSMVRDNALTLITKCIALKPDLESEFLPGILNLAADEATGVRKRVVKLLKEIYLRNSKIDIRARIGDSILQRIQDVDTSVSEVAHQTLEEIWIVPLWKLPDFKDTTTHNKIALREQFNMISKTALRQKGISPILENFFRQIMNANSKYSSANVRACKSLVATAFETFLDASENKDTQKEILSTLSIFAHAEPTLFSADQIQILQPYISNTLTTDDLAQLKLTVIIFGCVLPALPAIQQELLKTIQMSLFGVLQRLSKDELSEAAFCLWKINDTLKNVEKLLNILKSALQNVYKLQKVDFKDSAEQANLKRLRKYIWIVGAFGKNCNFEQYTGFFKSQCSWWDDRNNVSVAGLVVQTLKPFVAPTQPLSLRVEAMESIGIVCQAWPRQFTKKQISGTFEQILQKEEPVLKQAVLSSFRNFLGRIESQVATKFGNDPVKAPAERIKLGASATASDDDGASTLIAQAFLNDIVKVALSSQDRVALTASEVIASINRQGLAHPRSSGSTLVALATSENNKIANVAFEAHRILHQHHESALEQDYMRAVNEAFRYQTEVVGNNVGHTQQPTTAKLKRLWEVIRMSNAKYQKKFLSNFCAKIDFDIAKIDLTGSPPKALQFSRFLIENIALFEFNRLDELMHTITSMEKIVSSTGSGLAHSISTDVFHIVVEEEAVTDGQADSHPAHDKMSAEIQEGNPSASIPVDPARLYALTTGSIILFILWEARTFLRRLYGQNAGQNRQAGRSRPSLGGASKDLSKALIRNPNVSTDKFLTGIVNAIASLQTQHGMLSQCQKFVDLMRIDDEIKVSAGDSDDGASGGDSGGFMDRAETPGGDLADGEDRVGGDWDTPMSGSSKGGADGHGPVGFKRKNSGSAQSTPGKRKKSRPSLKGTKSGSRRSVDGDADEDGDWY